MFPDLIIFLLISSCPIANRTKSTVTTAIVYIADSGNSIELSVSM